MCRLAKCIKRNSSLYRKARLNLYASYASVCKAKLATYIYLIGMFLSFLGFVAPKILEFGSSDGEDIEGMHGTIGIWAYCLRDDGANINDCFNYAVGSFCTDPLFSAAYRLNDDITEGAQIDCNTLLDLREYGFSGDTDACVRCDKLNSMRATALMGFIAAWSCLFFLSMVRAFFQCLHAYTLYGYICICMFVHF